MRRNEKVVRPPSPLRPATWDQPVLDNLLHCQAITTVVNHPWESRQQLGHQIWPQICPGQLAGVEVFLHEGRVQCEDLLHQRRDLGVLDDGTIVTLTALIETTFHGKPFQVASGKSG